MKGAHWKENRRVELLAVLYSVQRQKTHNSSHYAQHPFTFDAYFKFPGEKRVSWQAFKELFSCFALNRMYSCNWPNLWKQHNRKKLHCCYTGAPNLSLSLSKITWLGLIPPSLFLHRNTLLQLQVDAVNITGWWGSTGSFKLNKLNRFHNKKVRNHFFPSQIPVWFRSHVAQWHEAIF